MVRGGDHGGGGGACERDPTSSTGPNSLLGSPQILVLRTQRSWTTIATATTTDPVPSASAIAGVGAGAGSAIASGGDGGSSRTHPCRRHPAPRLCVVSRALKN